METYDIPSRLSAICRCFCREDEDLHGYNQRIFTNYAIAGEDEDVSEEANALGTPAKPAEHRFCTTFCRQRENMTLVAVSIFSYRYVRRADEDFKSHKQRILTNCSMDKG